MDVGRAHGSGNQNLRTGESRARDAGVTNRGRSFFALPLSASPAEASEGVDGEGQGRPSPFYFLPTLF